MTHLPAHDDFDLVLAEKLWTLIPAVYRDLDGEGENPGALRALIELIATQAAHLRRSHDRLWDDQMIELCADWAVPYIGDLLATRVLPKDAGRGARIDVAKTIYYRKRKGTPAILEQLASDIAGWDGVVAEGFKRLARMPHGLDAPRDAAKWAAIAPMQDAAALGQIGGPFSTLQHLPDIAKPNGRDGRFGINRVALHLYRLRSYAVSNAVARPDGARAGAFTFDPSGRDVPLFARRGREAQNGDALDWDGWRPARPWDVPAPMPCRLLGEEIYEITTQTQQRLIADGMADATASELSPLIGRRLVNRAALRIALLTRPSSAQFLAPGALSAIRETALVADCGKSQLIPRSVTVEIDAAPAVDMESLEIGTLADWNDARFTGGLVIDPVRGRFLFPTGTPPGRLRINWFSGHAGAIGAGNFVRPNALPAPTTTRVDGANVTAASLPRNGSLRLSGNAIWSQPSNRTAITSLNIHAAPGHRPYVRLTTNWSLAAAPAGNAILHIDGLWIGAETPLSLRLAGDWEEVRFSNVTLDPGGAQTGDAARPILPPVTLRIAGTVENLIVERSILGRIVTGPAGALENLRVEDSILQHPNTLSPLDDTNITIDRSTVLGNVGGRRIDVSNSLIDGVTRPRDVQNGCFRFSAAHDGSDRPRPYRSHLIRPGTAVFASRRFGDPDFARLRQHVPNDLHTGAEGDQEMGAYHSLGDNARLDGLKTKVAEYAPFGILPVYIFET